MTRRGRVLEKLSIYGDGEFRKAATDHYCFGDHRSGDPERVIHKGEKYVHCPRSSNNWNGKVNYHADCAIKAGILVDREPAQLAVDTVKNYSSRVGLDRAKLEDRVVNLLVDLRHLAASESFNFEAMLQASAQVFEEE